MSIRGQYARACRHKHRLGLPDRAPQPFQTTSARRTFTRHSVATYTSARTTTGPGLPDRIPQRKANPFQTIGTLRTLARHSVATAASTPPHFKKTPRTLPGGGVSGVTGASGEAGQDRMNAGRNSEQMQESEQPHGKRDDAKGIGGQGVGGVKDAFEVGNHRQLPFCCHFVPISRRVCKELFRNIRHILSGGFLFLMRFTVFK